MPGVVALLLAAGESRRMGQLKALLPWRGTCLLDHQVTSLIQAGADQVVVVLGHQAERLQPVLNGNDRVTWAINPDYLQGKTTSIKAGLEIIGPMRPDVLLILNVDQPRSSQTVSCVLASHSASGSLISVPTYGGKGGHPIILAGELLEELKSIEEETQGIRSVVTKYKERTQRVEIEAPEVLWDLNTPEQYQEALGGW